MESTIKTSNQKLISQLNNLVEINNDRIQGYERAISETDDDELKSAFREMADHSKNYKAELSREIQSVGGKPSGGTKNSGKIFRAWMDIKAALTGKNRKEILSSCEFGEEAALEVYDEVLNANVVLTGSIRKMLLHQKKEIQQDHDKIKTLHDTVKK